MGRGDRPNGLGHRPGPLVDVLGDPAVEIVFHAGRQDVAILRRVWRAELTNIFDTQIARASPACARSSATRRC